MLLRTVLACIVAMYCTRADAQATKGTWFVHWGYNRAWYGASDIHFDGPGYAFTLAQVQARDRPVPFSSKAYLTPRNIWIPQYNYRVGRYLNEHWSLSLGLDHMKYVVSQGQRVGFNGELSMDASAVPDAEQRIVITPDLLQYEHTDGLNLLSVDLDRHHRLWQGMQDRSGLHVFGGVHAGPVIPRTDVRLFGEGLNNRFNVAGFGLGAQAGLQFNFLRHFYVRNTLRTGWIDLPNVLTTGSRQAHASQHFTYVQHAVMVGGQFRIGRREK